MKDKADPFDAYPLGLGQNTGIGADYVNGDFSRGVILHEDPDLSYLGGIHRPRTRIVVRATDDHGVLLAHFEQCSESTVDSLGSPYWYPVPPRDEERGLWMHLIVFEIMSRWGKEEAPDPTGRMVPVRERFMERPMGWSVRPYVPGPADDDAPISPCGNYIWKDGTSRVTAEPGPRAKAHNGGKPSGKDDKRIR